MEHELMRRATQVDLSRLASLAPVVVDESRCVALRGYVVDLSRVVDSQDRFVREVLWPTLSIAAAPSMDVPYAEDLTRADRAMRAAASPAVSGQELADRLGDAARLMAAVWSAEQRHLLPLLAAHPARVRLQLRYRRELPDGVLAFVVPWALRHADAAEARRLLAGADPAVGVALKIFGQRFTRREQLIFGVPS